MASFAVLIGAVLVLGTSVTLPVILAMVAAFLITGGGNSINDFYDIEADRINRPDRPIPSGRIGKRSVLSISLGLFVIGILLSAFINYLALGIAVLNSVLLAYYSGSLKRKLLVGNFAVSYLVGSTFLFGGAAAGDILLPGMLFVLSFLTNLSREISKTIEDEEGDRANLLKDVKPGEKQEEKGLNSIKHRKSLLAVSKISLILALVFSPIPFWVGLFGWPYIWFLIPADALFLASLVLIAFAGWRGHGKKLFSLSSKAIKFGMFFGLLAFLAGALA